MGCTQDVNLRLKQHNDGKVQSTRHYCPWVVLHLEKAGSYLMARRKEKYYKTRAGRKKIAEIIAQRRDVRVV